MRSAVRALLGGVLVASGAFKLLQPLESVLAVAAYGLLPARVAVAGALALPGVEIAIGSALLAGVARRGAAVGAAVLAALFLVHTAWAWGRGLAASCGCFGPLSIADRAGPGMVLFDLALLAAALLGARGPGKSPRS